MNINNQAALFQWKMLTQIFERKKYKVYISQAALKIINLLNL